MSLARAFTKRVRRTDASTTHVDSIRNQISGPVALISTTNMLSYNAPDLVDYRNNTVEPMIPSTPSTPTRSSIDNDSDASTPSNASTEATSVESSPSTDHSTIPGYFHKASLSSPSSKAIALDDAPTLPKRALSHSKREHERLARKRSVQFSRPSSAQSAKEPSHSFTSSDNTRSSGISVGNNSSSTNPFSRELEQLSEVAEEFGAVVREAAFEEDLAVMQSRGLLKFAAQDYVLEIEPLWEMVFEEVSPGSDLEVWI